MVMKPSQTLLVDLMPTQRSSIITCVHRLGLPIPHEFHRFYSCQNNIVRCSMGAAMVSVMNPILVAIGGGWTYTLLGSLCVLVSPLLYVEIRWEPMWRERRREQAQRRIGTNSDGDSRTKEAP